MDEVDFISWLRTMRDFFQIDGLIGKILRFPAGLFSVGKTPPRWSVCDCSSSFGAKEDFT
jgi:hypothetical protein